MICWFTLWIASCILVCRSVSRSFGRSLRFEDEVPFGWIWIKAGRRSESFEIYYTIWRIQGCAAGSGVSCRFELDVLMVAGSWLDRSSVQKRLGQSLSRLEEFLRVFSWTAWTSVVGGRARREMALGFSWTAWAWVPCERARRESLGVFSWTVWKLVVGGGARREGLSTLGVCLRELP